MSVTFRQLHHIGKTHNRTDCRHQTVVYHLLGKSRDGCIRHTPDNTHQQT